MSRAKQIEMSKKTIPGDRIVYCVLNKVSMGYLQITAASLELESSHFGNIQLHIRAGAWYNTLTETPSWRANPIRSSR